MATSLALFSDFGFADVYVGQVKAVLCQRAPQVPVVDLLHDAPDFNPRASAHLLAALASQFPPGTVFFCVVDPGVGGARSPVALQADGKWYVGPDNGLLSVVAARAQRTACHRIAWRPQRLSDSFHGRDLFAPVAAALAAGSLTRDWLEPIAELEVNLGSEGVAEVVYVDHYGNAMTGLLAGRVDQQAELYVGASNIPYARVFSEVPKGAAFWHENSIGLIEIAVNCGAAARRFNLAPGSQITVIQPTHGKP